MPAHACCVEQETVRLTQVGHQYVADPVATLDRLLTARERSLFGRCAPARRLSWLAGRAAVWQLRRRVSGDDRPVQVWYDSGSRPVSYGFDTLSISHAGDLAVCAAVLSAGTTSAAVGNPGPGTVGIDVEPLNRAGLVCAQATGPEELSTAHALADHAGIPSRYAGTVAWTLKEAAAKAVGVGLSMGWDTVRVSGVRDVDPGTGLALLSIRLWNGSRLTAVAGCRELDGHAISRVHLPDPQSDDGAVPAPIGQPARHRRATTVEAPRV